MPLIKSKSKAALKKNIATEMRAHPGPEHRAQNIAIAYTTKKRSKKAAGGSVQSGSRDMNYADGGTVNKGSPHLIIDQNDSDEVKHSKAQQINKEYPGNHPVAVQERRRHLNGHKPKKKMPEGGMYAAGGSVKSGSRDMESDNDSQSYAEGGEVNSKYRRRPMPDSRYNDSKTVSHNSGNKASKNDSWTDNSTIRQAQNNNGRMVKPIKSPRFVGSDAFSVRNHDMHDDEANMMDRLPPESDLAQPVKRDDEYDAKKMGSDPDMAPQHNNGRKPYNKEIEDQYAQDMAAAEMKKVQSYAAGGSVQSGSRDMNYAKGGPVMEPKDHDRELMERDDERHMQSELDPSEDEGDSNAHKRNELYQKQTSGNPDSEKSHAKSSRMMHDDESSEDESEEHRMDEEHDSQRKVYSDEMDDQPDDEAGLDHAASVAAAVMSRMKRRKMARGGELLEDNDDIHSHGSTDSDDSDQADIARNADEDANEEDQLSFNALRKENYSESDGLDELDRPIMENLHGDQEEEDQENVHDKSLSSKIRSKMKKRSSISR